MGDSLDHFEQPHQTSSRLGSRITAGEIVQVQGGHIVRSIGLKDRHSKVCTAKGPRDRRVRLAAHTAIQFYDVQDRLGYDRPSKAVDWLINKAKTAIDELAELPAWNPTSNLSSSSNLSQQKPQKRQLGTNHSDVVVGGGVAAGSSSKRAMTMVGNETEAPQGLQQSFNFLHPSLDSDSIADTIKSFFPVGGGASAGGNSSRMQFQSFPPPELLSRTSSQSQELRLSLQSFQDPISLHHHLHQHIPQSQHQHQASITEPQAHVQGHALLSGANNLGFDVSSWSENHQPIDFGRFQRLNAWNSCGDGPNSGEAAGGYLFSSQPMQQQQPLLLQQLLGQNQVFSQRGPLQSNNSPSIRAWMDPSMLAIATADHNIQQHHQYQAVHPIYPSSSSSSAIGFASSLGGFSGSRIPARIQGEGEEHDGISKKPSSASSDSRH